MFIFCPRRQKTNQKSAAWGWEGFNQTKAPKTKNFKIAWLSLDFNISPSPRPLPLCGHSPAAGARLTIKGKTFFCLRSVAVILWKLFAFKGKSFLSRVLLLDKVAFFCRISPLKPKASLPLCLHRRVRTKKYADPDKGTKASSPSLSRERPRELRKICPFSYTLYSE